ncbi:MULTISPECIES: hypothetical protein [Ralstonia]|jgi:hypothetical protein|uniref:Uncharacterized protein n=2 Tax=Ralstonia pickettii TaxID=329 RepID=A0ABM9IVJ4_RALPI|nr:MULTISPECIES: hypothetical protein [Ralstonia]MCL6485101.1 hypothetical protein [Janthinobacterium lividum]MBA4233584.1 hypothetical protein [Ralstonia sp.]MBA4238521.1 hypothetical protein [Ralstonia sp.]MBA4404481.1 hypothetical protein [Ralstonia sp.]POH87430.1 hypothetical protein CJ026_011285 [Ralstonia pickettii]
MNNPKNAASAVKQTGKNGKIGAGAPGPGRKKGVPNKTTQAAKDAIVIAAEELGGVDRLVAWVKADPANERVFWGTIYPKLLPLQVSGEGGGPLQLVLNGSDVHG